MKELPDVPDILLTVRDFLHGLAPTLSSGQKFEAQVAVHLLDIARRELALREIERSDTGAQAIGTLCADIRSGARDAQWDETLQDALEAAIARVRVVRPAHLAGDESAAP